MPSRVQLLVGTRKGAFIYSSNEQRKRWTISEPMLPGWSIYHLAADARGDTPRLYAAANHWAWGPSVAKSVDGGNTWDWRSTGLGFPQDMGIAVGNVWHVQPGHVTEPGIVYAGTQPAGLFRSADWGRSWTPVEALNRHPTRERWSGTGGGDSCAHSLEIDPRNPRRLYVAVSAGGSFTSVDGGDNWTIFSHTAIPQTTKAREFTKEISQQFPDSVPPDVDPLAINEMHKMRLDAKNPQCIWTQTHVGVFRSGDGGNSWSDVTEGLPSFHGFPIAITRRAPDAAFVVPLAMEGAMNNFRVCPGQFTVYRTRDEGASWEALTEGLPGPADYQSIYREGLDTDGLDPEGVYAGTSNGQVFASADGGDHWQRLPGTLPPVLSVTAAVW